MQALTGSIIASQGLFRTEKGSKGCVRQQNAEGL